MRIFKTKVFSRWAKKNAVIDTQLITAAEEIKAGIFDANLGGFVLKKRIGTKNRGKRSSIRTIIVYKIKKHCFFIYGFEKKDKDNISLNEEKAFKLIAKELTAYPDEMLDELVANNRLFEVKYEKK